jgi:outer membrane protein OmpA-like peptidoglycan-associated protein
MYIIGISILSACASPNPGATLAKVNGAPTAYADDVARRGEDKRTWDDMASPPKMPIVYFDRNSYALRIGDVEEMSYAAMSTNVDWLCQVDGYASDEGTTEYNLALGQRRAHAVASYLESYHGIKTKETSYGEERPAATRELSRRVEIRCK